MYLGAPGDSMRGLAAMETFATNRAAVGSKPSKKEDFSKLECAVRTSQLKARTRRCQQLLLLGVAWLAVTVAGLQAQAPSSRLSMPAATASTPTSIAIVLSRGINLLGVPLRPAVTDAIDAAWLARATGAHFVVALSETGQFRVYLPDLGVPPFPLAGNQAYLLSAPQSLVLSAKAGPWPFSQRERSLRRGLNLLALPGYPTCAITGADLLRMTDAFALYRQIGGCGQGSRFLVEVPGASTVSAPVRTGEGFLLSARTVQSVSLPVDIVPCLRLPRPLRQSSNELVLEDFSDVVTQNDFGFNDFSGNGGDLNSVSDAAFATGTLRCIDAARCHIALSWDFGADTTGTASTGRFFSLMGLTDTKTSLDGHTVLTTEFPEHTLNLDDIDAPLQEPGGPRAIIAILANVGNLSQGPLTLRLELKDTLGVERFKRFSLPASETATTITWNYRTPEEFIDEPSGFSPTQAKVFSLLVEHGRGTDRENTTTGTLTIHKIALLMDRADAEPVADDALLELVTRRCVQYFVDWTSRKPASRGLPQDRSNCGDLLTVGGIGFLVGAQVIAAERGYLSRKAAAKRVLDVLQVLDDPEAFGPERIGKLGYRGWLYHFLGPDGRRKINFDLPSTPALREDLRTVELASIDTGLALMGVWLAQSYFDQSGTVEEEIQTRAQRIYDRVEWPFMLNSATGQFYLAWKPTEPMGVTTNFQVPDAEGQGFYSSKPTGEPGTLDFYTDEALIILLLAIGSQTHPVPPDLWCRLIRQRDPDGFVRTFPGALFTYLFLNAFVDTGAFDLRNIRCQDEPALDLRANSQAAVERTIAYTTRNPCNLATYGTEAWGLSAAEGPSDQYRAYGAAPVAAADIPEEDGTVTYYGMVSAISLSEEHRRRAIQAIRAAWDRGHWHPRFGLADAFNEDIAQRPLDVEPGTENRILRSRGRWVNRALFAIDVGPMLLHIENARTGLIWRMMQKNPNYQRAIDRLQDALGAPATLAFEGEAGFGDGQTMQRSQASSQATVRLQAGEQQRYTFLLPVAATYRILLRYSNDNANSSPTEALQVQVDGFDIGSATAVDTGDGGSGWNVFATASDVGIVALGVGSHTLEVTVTGGDGFGVELDTVKLERVALDGL